MSATGSRVHPTTVDNRIESIDALRGLALLGILIANIYVFALAPQQSAWVDTLDKAVKFGVGVFVSGKFIILFTLLFGMSFALQMRKFRDDDTRALHIFLRRQIGLLVVGLAHAILLSSQDILVFYAILGLAIWPFRHKSAHFIIGWAVILYVFSFLPAQYSRTMRLLDDDNSAKSTTTLSPPAVSLRESAYAGGTFLEITRHRVQEFVDGPTTDVVRYMRKLPFFLVGYCLVTFGWLTKLLHDGPRLGRLAAVALTIGLTGRSLIYLTYLPDAREWAVLVRLPLAAISNPALSLGYAAALFWLYQARFGRFLLQPLAATGRAALSNYIFQSVICTTLFYSYGVGLYSTQGPFRLLLISLAIFVVQVALSVLWLRKYRFGPLEWLWRSFTYRKMQPMLRA